MKCKVCGAELRMDNMFCSECGSAVERQNAAIQPPEPTTPQLEFQQSTQPVDMEQEQKPQKKKKKKWLVITSIVTAAALAVGSVVAYLAFHPVVYLRTSMKKYDADGEWVQTVEYEYNKQGSLTCVKEISPDYDRVPIVQWVEELQSEVIVGYNTTPNGGKMVTATEYKYNDEGHCIYHMRSRKTYDREGAEVDPSFELENSKDFNYTYHYNDDGTIKSIDFYSILSGGGTGELAGEYCYHYDDEGRLHEISCFSDSINLEFIDSDFRYDEDGRLTVSCYREREAMILCEYGYDKKGRIESVKRSTGFYQAPFDDEHFTELYAHDAKITMMDETKFEYDSKGRLVSRTTYNPDGTTEYWTECEYDGKQLSKISYANCEIEITDDEDKAESIAENLGEGDMVMVRDKHGNIRKVIGDNGAYAECEYRAVRLPRKLARQHDSIMYAANRVDLTGRTEYLGVMPFGGRNGAVSYVTIPTSDLYMFDVILNDLQ